MNATERPLIVVVNDDTAFLQLMEQLLDDEGYEAEALKSTTNAIEHIKKRRPALIILDVRINNEESGLVLLDLMTLDPERDRSPWSSRARTCRRWPGVRLSSRTRASTRSRSRSTSTILPD